MTEDSDGDGPALWPPAMFSGMQEASEQAAEAQMEMFKKFMSGSAPGLEEFSRLGNFGMGAAMFKTRVQSGGRISIPDAEREALDIQEEDIVQAVIIPVKRNRDRED